MIRVMASVPPLLTPWVSKWARIWPFQARRVRPSLATSGIGQVWKLSNSLIAIWRLSPELRGRWSEVVERFHDEGGPFLAENLRGECGFDVHTHPSQWTSPSRPSPTGLGSSRPAI